MIRTLIAMLTALVIAPHAYSDTIRIATYNIELTRDGPGLVLRDLRRGSDPQIDAITQVIDTVAPDVLAIQGLDYDFGLETLKAFNASLAKPYPHLFALPTNRGLQTGLDLDGNGRMGEASDAQGFGRFYGQGAMALLSRLTIDEGRVQSFDDVLWQDVPQTQMPRYEDGTPFPSTRAAQVQRLSSSGHWIVPLGLNASQNVSLMMFHATPPVFDGPEDRNGLRNADEIRLWQHVLNGDLGMAPDSAFIIAGSATLDPFDSDGRNQAIRDLIRDPRVQDPEPRSDGAARAPEQGHQGPSALDTVDWPEVGRLRVDYLLPSTDLAVDAAGVYWPPVGSAGHQAALRASRHRLVWVDIRLTD